MKRVYIGDIHGREIWKDIISKEKTKYIRFIGDYFDPYDPSLCDIEINNFVDICDYLQSNKLAVALLGNHDHHYLTEVGYTGTSRYNSKNAKFINDVLESNKHLFQMAHADDDILMSHAGVSMDWLNLLNYSGNYTASDIANFVNNVDTKEFTFKAISPDRLRISDLSGDNSYQSPIWIRPYSLIVNNKEKLNTKVIQILGHTRVGSIDLNNAALNNRYFLIDALEQGEYLIWENNKFSIGKI